VLFHILLENHAVKRKKKIIMIMLKSAAKKVEGAGRAPATLEKTPQMKNA
jgi:hypothetical protein